MFAQWRRRKSPSFTYIYQKILLNIKNWMCLTLREHSEIMFSLFNKSIFCQILHLQICSLISFTFMHLCRHFYPKRLTVHSGYTFIVSMCSLGIEPTTFALLTQCSTTEPQEHTHKLTVKMIFGHNQEYSRSITKMNWLYYNPLLVRQTIIHWEDEYALLI